MKTTSPTCGRGSRRIRSKSRFCAWTAHAKALNDKGCVVSTADWERRDVQRKVAGRPPRPVPPYVGTKKGYVEYAKETQKSIRRTVCLFRRDLLGAIAKPGWFEE